MFLFKKESVPLNSIKIELRITGSLFYVVLKSRVKLKLLLDSGASNTQIADYALHKCIYKKTGEVLSISGVSDSIEAEEVHLSLSTIDNLYTKILSSACIADDQWFCYKMRKLHIDGLLGMDFLKGCMIDLSDEVLIISEIK